jgi:hypothetical protein
MTSRTQRSADPNERHKRTARRRSDHADKALRMRSPALWRDPASTLPAPAEEMAAAVTGHVQLGGRMFVSWRVFSGMLAALLLLVLALMFASETFYVTDLAISGLETISAREVAELSGVERMHLFWLDPEQITAALLQSPAIARAQVMVNFPPQGVQIVIQEREPALVWEQAGVASWVDVQGRVMRQREDRPDLLRVAADPLLEGEVGEALDVDIVTGALQLHQLLPDVPTLRYHPDRGLGYNDPRGWAIWFGTGTTMPDKYVVYTAVVQDLLARGVVFQELNISDPNAPVYCCRGN